jgi:2-hydroxychromene-2-carboxylate isomerase
MEKINFYFDYLSPFSFFAWKKIVKKPDLYHFIPVSLGVILNHWQIKGPGEIAPKRLFLLKSCLRYAKKNNISFGTPKVHPFNSLYALRLSLKEVAGADQFRVIDALWNFGWVKREDLSNPESVIKWLNQNELPGELLYEKSFLPDSKKALKTNIQNAIDQGVFGVPSFTFKNELFWGNDSMDDLFAWIDGEKGYDEDYLNTLIDQTSRGANQAI